MNSKKIIDGITIGFALFAMFFGAGNLILPPFIGLMAGENWVASISGFSLTAILAPFLGILVVVLSGDSFRDLGNRVNKYFAVILATLIMLIIGPLVAIPRTAATTFEVGVLPLAPNFSSVISSVLFFGVVMALSISPSKVVDIIGKFLTPFLLILLSILIISGIINPMDLSALDTQYNPNAFFDGFEEGYQTMDVLASVVFASIIITAVISKGYTTVKEKTNISLASGFVAVLCLFFIYGGLVYLGATSGYPITDNIKRTDLLLYISNGLLGSGGMLTLSLSITLACLTTAIALVCAVGTFFAHLTRGFLTYRLTVIITCVLSSVLAIKGVDEIINYAFPILAFIYPITLTMVIYIAVFGTIVKRKAPYVGAVLATFVISIIDSIQKFIRVKESTTVLSEKYITTLEYIDKFKSFIPLNEYNLSWVVPSFVFFIVFYILDVIFFKRKMNVFVD